MPLLWYRNVFRWMLNSLDFRVSLMGYRILLLILKWYQNTSSVSKPGIEIHFDNTPNLVYLDWLFPCIKVVSKATLLHQNSCFSCFFHLFLHIQASPSCFHNPWIFALPCTHIPAHVILFLLHSSLHVNIDLQFGA